MLISSSKFRLIKKIWRPLLEKKFRETHAAHIAFNYVQLGKELEKFIDEKLKEFDESLYIFFNTVEIKKIKEGGYHKATLYRRFNEKYKTPPSKELVNLLCYYIKGKSYEKYVEDCSNGRSEIDIPIDLENFKTLPSFTERSHYIKNRLAEKGEVIVESCTWNEIKHLFENCENENYTFNGYIEFNKDKINARLLLSKDIFKGLKIFGEAIAAFYILYPINKIAIDFIRTPSKERKTANDFPDEYFCKSYKSRDASALYLSTVFSPKNKSIERARLWEELLNEIIQALIKHSHLIGIFTYARTKEGKIRAKKYGFTKLKQSKTFYFLSREDFLKKYSKFIRQY